MFWVLKILFYLQFVSPVDLLVVSAYDGDTDISTEILFEITAAECKDMHNSTNKVTQNLTIIN